MLKFTLVMGLAILLPPASGHVDALPQRGQRSVEQAFRWEGRITSGRWVWIRNLKGSISSEPTDGADMVVTARKSWRRSDPDDVQIVAVPHDGTVTICALWDARHRDCGEEGDYEHHDVWNDHDDVEVHFIVKLPRGIRLDASTVSGDIDVVRADAPVRARSVSGDVSVSGNTSEADVHTVSGAVIVEGANDQVRAHSVSGPVTVTGARGEIFAKSVSGDIEVTGGDFQEGKFETVSGSIGFEGRLNDRGYFRFKTLSGSVRLVLPDDVSAEFDISTFSGSIGNDFGSTGRQRRRYGPGRDLRFTHGGGGAEVEVETFSGNVRLRRR